MAERVERLQDDIDSLQSLSIDCVYLEVHNFDSDSLQMKFVNPLEENCNLEFIFNFSTADYPEGTVLSSSDPDVPICTESRPLLEVVATKCFEWCRQHRLEVPLFAELIRDKMKETQPKPLYSQVSAASTDCTETSDTDMDAYDGFEDDEVEEDNFVHPVLEWEISQVQLKFGHNSIETRIHAGIDEMDLFFNIDLNGFLNSYTCSAWGVNLEQPLVILLHIRSVSKYLDGVEPQVEVFQDSKQTGEKIKVGMGVQIKKIMEMFASSQWKSISNSKMEERIMETKTTGTTGITGTTGYGDSSSQGRESLPTPGHKLEKQSSLGAQMSKFSNTTTSQAEKTPPSIENGFLVQFLQYALNRIQSLNEFCVICDEKHVLGTELLKPCVCTRELCVFAFQTLGVMADAAEAIATDANVVDLLIAMANAAAQSSRSELILDPYPSIVDPDDTSQLALDSKAKDFTFLRTVLEDVVKCREQVIKGRVLSFEKSLAGYHKLAFPLMQWIIATCRAHIVILPPERLLKTMKTKYQFLLINSPPKKEVAFKNAKEKFGSTFAFHGSNVENWHSIMRVGLIKASGTKYQLHGAAHGSGIYLSPNSNVSFGYTSSRDITKKTSKENTQCLAGKLNLRCLALCEVVTKDLKRSNDIWVCLNPDYVCTRFFFVYDTSYTCTANTSDSHFKKEIGHAMEYIKAVKAVT